MKATINGLRLDTETSTEVGGATSGGVLSDLRYFSETLYRTPRSGRYFLAGEGGPLTRYSRTIGQGRSTFGHRIIPLTHDEAVEWGKRNLSAAEFKKEFGDTRKRA